MIYLDNAATTKPCEQAVKAATENMRQNFGNPSSLHGLGIEAEKAVNSAKKTILSRLSASGELLFTSGATESNNLAIFGTAQARRRRGNRVVTTAMEHPSVARCFDKLEEQGFEVVRLRPAGHENFEQAIIDAVDEKTILVSFMAVNNETGFITDSLTVYPAIKKKYPDCVVHVDGVQGFCKVPIKADLISISAHKIHGIKGVGGLFAAKNTRILPIIFGGGQQKNLRSGTEAVDLIAAFGAAVNSSPSDIITKLSALRAHLLQLLAELDGVYINSTDSCLPSIVNFSVSGVRSEIMLHFLEESGIFVSSGSACSKGKVSPVLSALGIPDKNADSALRVSFCRDNTTDEIDTLITQLEIGISRFRKEYRK